MSTEKIYYALLALFTAAGMLLSPFFLIRHQRALPAATPERWRKIWLANALALLPVGGLLWRCHGG